MILEIVFILGLTTGIVAGLILFFIIFHEEIKVVKEFNERQEKYRKMI